MSNKKLYFYKILFLVCVFCFLTLFMFAGCGLFGGGKEKPQAIESPKPGEKSEASPKDEKTPLVVADKAQFQEGKLDVKKEVKLRDPNGNVVEGSLNWTKGVVRAIGHGVAPMNKPLPVVRLSAREAAYRIALANLLEITKGVQLTSTTTVEDMMLKSQKIETTVQGVIKGAIILGESYKEEEQTVIASVEVGIVLESIAGAIPSDFPGFQRLEALPPDYFKPVFAPRNVTLEVLDPGNKIIPKEAMSDLKKVEDILSKLEKNLDQQDELYGRLKELQAEVEALKKAEKTEIKLSGKPPEEHYSGIVVNAAGLQLVENVYAKIYYKDGDDYKILYGDVDNNRPNSEVLMWSGWESTMDNAITSDRVAQSPIIVNAVAVGKNGEPVISIEDAKKIETFEKEGKLMEKGRIVFVL